MTIALDSFEQTVGLAFASRPTLRAVVHQQLVQRLAKQYPEIDKSYPQLRGSKEIYLCTRAPEDLDTLTIKSLAEVFLEKLISQTTFNFTGIALSNCFLSFTPTPRPIYDRDATSGLGRLPDLTLVTDAFNELLANVEPFLQRAQVDFWQTRSGSGGTPLQGVGHMLKAALASGVEAQGLDDEQRSCIYALLAASNSTAWHNPSEVPEVFLLDVTVAGAEVRYQQLLPDLLVTLTLANRNIVLLCKPSGRIDAFDSLDSMAQSLSDGLARQYQLDSFGWDRYPITTDMFAMQGAVLLNLLLEGLEPVNGRHFSTVVELEQGYAALTDPASFFCAHPYRLLQLRQGESELPQWLRQASMADRLEYRTRVLDLLVAQASSNGKSSLDGILDLRAFTRQSLLELMRADHLTEANYDADDLVLEFWLARGVPGTFSGSVEIKRMPLTEFAIGNLGSARGAILKKITHKTDQLLWPWLTTDYLKALVQRADIGRTYPQYLSKKLQDADQNVERIGLFAMEQASQLPLLALKAKIDGALSDTGYQRVVTFFRADSGESQSLLAPLAFKREETASEADRVTNTFVFMSAHAAGKVVLYRPMSADRPFQEFASQQALLEQILAQEDLQQSILAWMSSDAQRVYGHGGFQEPHLRRPILDTQLGLEPVQPAQLDLQGWHPGADSNLYMANTQMLVELAERETISNAEDRWAMLLEGAGLLFNLLFSVATPFLRGPAAVVAWLVQGALTVHADADALKNGNEFEKSTAVVDLLLNLVMVLFHASLPKVEPPVAADKREVPVFGPSRRFTPSVPRAIPVQGKTFAPSALRVKADLELDFSWYGPQGLKSNSTDYPRPISGFRSSASLGSHPPLSQGSYRGLYLLAGRYYALIEGHVYNVRADAQGMRVVDEQGRPGPWLTIENNTWQFDLSLRLRGGGPKRRVAGQQEVNQEAVRKLQSEIGELDLKNNALVAELTPQWASMAEHSSALQKLLNLRDSLQARIDQGDSTEGLSALVDSTRIKITDKKSLLDTTRSALIDTLEQSIKIDLEVEASMKTLLTPKFSKFLPEVTARPLKQRRGMVRKQLLRNYMLIHDELILLARFDELAALRKQIVTLPATPEQVAAYNTYRARHMAVVPLQLRLQEVMEKLDVLLIDTLTDGTIAYDGKQEQVHSIVGQRSVTTLQLKIDLIRDLAELSLERLSGTDVQTLVSTNDYLIGKSVSGAGSTLDELISGNFASEETISGLQSVQSEYANALTMVDYLERFGGVVVNKQALNYYKEQVRLVKATAELELEAAVREQKWETPLPFKRLPYKPRVGMRRVVHLRGGKTLVGEETQLLGEPVVEQRDPVSKKVLGTYHQQGDVWIEVVPATFPVESAPLTASERAQARIQAQRLNNEVAGVIALAKRYISSNEPHSLSFVIERHVEKLQRVARMLEGADAAASDNALRATVEQCISRLNERKRNLLVTLHLASSRPNGESLAYLHAEGQITIARTVERKKLAADDYLDVYEVRKAQGPARDSGLWEVHLHYGSQAANQRQFSKGHLKLWAERTWGRETQLQAAKTNQQFLEIYRADLKASQFERILPWD
ncbi:hypothetical protein EI533_00940 [Pseudomonas donghuensis]|nr:hypothetical protein [Pseudomonas donghuensis]